MFLSPVVDRISVAIKMECIRHTCVTNHDVQPVRLSSDLIRRIFDGTDIAQIALDEFDSLIFLSKTDVLVCAPSIERILILGFATGKNEDLLDPVQEELSRDF
jgi:hypothetical protein